MAAENEVGKVSLGVELSTDPLASQAAGFEREIERIAEKAGERAGKKFAEEAAKAFSKNTDKIGEAGEKAGEDAGKGAEKGLKRGSKGISAESGDAGDKAGKSFISRFNKSAGGDGIMGAFKGIAGKIAKAAAAAFAAKKIFDFGKMAVNLGSDLNEVQNVVDSTFGEGSAAQKSVNDFAKNAATQFGLSETMAKRYAGTFGAMGRSFGFSADQAAEMSTKLAGLSGDVASFYNISQDEAYTKLKSVFTGETESLKDLGVVMTQANLDQFALSHGLGTTTARMSEQQKVALRYQFVLEKLNTASNDFARTSGSWANQVRLLKLQFESLAATIGQVLIAALTPAIRALNAFMGALVKAANTFKSFVFSLFGMESADMGTGAGSSLPGTLGDIADSAGGAADSLGDVGDAASGAGKDASKAANEIKRSLASFDKITKLTDQSDSSGGSGGSGGGGGGGGGGGAGGGSGSLGDTSSALTNTAWSVASSNGPLDKIMEKLQALKDLFMNGFWEGLGDLSVFDSIRENIEGIGQHLKNIFTDPEVVKAASDYADKVAYNLGRMAGATVSVGATIVDNITGGIEKYLEQHENDIKQALIRCFNISGDIYDIAGDFATAFADVFSIFRSDEAKQITADLINIFATGFDTVLETALKFSRDILDNITKPFIENKDKIKTSLEGTIGQISTILSAVSDTVTAASKVIGKLYDEHIKPLLDSLGDGISDIVSTFLDAWEQHVRPVLDDLSNKFADVCEAHIIPLIESLGETLGSVVDLVKTLWETILQPLIKWVIDNIMPVLGDMAESMGGALLDAITLVADGIKELSDFIKPAIDFITNLIDAISNLNSDNVLGESKAAGGGVIEGVLSGILEGVKNIGTWVYDNIVKPFIDGFKEKFGIHSPSTVMAELGGHVINGFLQGIKDFFKDPIGWVKDNIVDPFMEGFDGFNPIEALYDAASTIKEVVIKFLGEQDPTFVEGKQAFDGIRDGSAEKTLTAGVTTLFNEGKKQFDEVKNGTATKTITGEQAKAFSTVKTAFSGVVSNTATKTISGAYHSNKSFQTVNTAFRGLVSNTAIKTVTGSIHRNFTNTKNTYNALKSNSATKTVNGNRSGSFNTAYDRFSAIKSKTATIHVATSGTDKLTSLQNKITRVMNSMKKMKNVRVSTGMATGGVYTPGGGWSAIPQYASGGPVHGSMFIAGEAGPEVVGHVGGRTEVLNKSQMASTMHSAVVNGMTAVSNNLARVMAGTMSSCTETVVRDMSMHLPRLADIGNGIRSETAQLVAYAKQAEAASGAGNIQEVIDILRRILEILIDLDPDIYIDGQKITSKIISIINAQTRATGRCPIIV